MKTPITCKLPRHRWIVVVALGALCGGEIVAQKKTGAARDARKNEPDSFEICYNPAAPVRQLAQYSLIVVDYAYPRDAVAVLRKQQKTVLGYLSLGKVHRTRPFVDQIRRLGIGLVQDRDFPDSFRIDVADPRWHQLVTRTIIPGMKKAGFSGLFLDDLDDIGTRKQEKQGVALIRAIRRQHPDLRLMANRGLEYLADFARDVDYSLLESCFVLGGRLRPVSDPDWAIQKLAAGKAANPMLVGVAVDYYARTGGRLTGEQSALITRVRELHAKHGLPSCITTEDLQFLPPLRKN
ncbi:MAG: endo alpha-1,4 polygalactosaminidase [Planctomycetota bacterium]|nr:endo alpha-1,4 polygalactosaminidase [Planctomycetota bacterium]